ncbi:MAG: hypothetical protein RI950_656, partial [Bacteroidota bacterium]
TELISANQIAEASALNPGLQSANVAGIYATMYGAGTGGTSGHDDFGHKSYDMYGDMLSGDMALTSVIYGWFRTITEFQTTVDYTQSDNYQVWRFYYRLIFAANTVIDNYQVWRFYYRLIFAANTVIDGLGGSESIPGTAAGRWYMGQAKAMRAFSYFYLAQYFQNEYNPSEKILPLYKNTTDPNLPKSTAADVYALMVKDLTDAQSLLSDFSRTNKSEVNASVAKGMLAYVHGAMGNNAAMKTVTADVISTGGFKIMTAAEATGGFNALATSQWMWGVDITVDSKLNLISWWGQMDLYTYSYAWAGDIKGMDKGLYDLIPSDDIRKAQFSASNKLAPIGKFYHPAKVIGGQRTIDADYVYMRVEEMYLLNAEACAKTGDEAGARKSLKAIMALRVPDASYIDALTGKALQDEIYLQTRVELWGEGKAYLSLKRNKGTTNRGSNHLKFVATPVLHNDTRLTFKIPIEEVQNNPNLNK